MGKIAYNWTKVNRGDIISFRYRTKEGRILRRTILVLEPKLRNKAKNPTSKYLLHGIQLEISNQPVISNIKTILESAGKVGVVDADKKIFNVELNRSTKNVYNKDNTNKEILKDVLDKDELNYFLINHKYKQWISQYSKEYIEMSEWYYGPELPYEIYCKEFKKVNKNTTYLDTPKDINELYFFIRN